VAPDLVNQQLLMGTRAMAGYLQVGDHLYVYNLVVNDVGVPSLDQVLGMESSIAADLVEISADLQQAG
jgi:septum formation inhibitor-activating ATPase MinD